MLSSSHHEDSFYVGHNTYSAEYKMATVEECLSRDVTAREFANEKGLPVSTFFSWITKYRKAGYN